MTTSGGYLDTSVLGCHAEGAAAGASARQVSVRAELETVLASGADLAVSELGLIEYHDMLWKRVRENQAPMFDESWAVASIDATMTLIRTGSLTVIPAPPKAPERAIQLVLYATRDHGLGFKLWDAMHLVIATSWAFERDEAVDFFTTDLDFVRFTAAVPAFGRWIALKDLNPP